MDLIAIDQDGRITARELYEFLQLNTAHFARWCKTNIEENEFAEADSDYNRFTVHGETPTGGAVERVDYYLTIPFAKKLCMLSKSERGDQARRYFLEVEKRYKQQVIALPKTYAEALRELAATVEVNEQYALQLAATQPKVDFYDQVAGSKDAIEIGEAARVLNMNIGRNRLFQVLRENKVLMHNNQPYQEAIDRGYFRVIEQKYTKPNGDTHINIKTLVYQKGLDYIRKLLHQKTAQGLA